MTGKAFSRLLAKVDFSTGSDGCWEWTAYRQHGYGIMHIDSIPRPAHRVLYEVAVGPIPRGQDLDHLCRNRACVNPSHLEPVTRRENLRRGEGWAGRNARKTHCPNGHLYDGENTYIQPGYGGRSAARVCRECRREKDRQRRPKGVPR